MKEMPLTRSLSMSSTCAFFTPADYLRLILFQAYAQVFSDFSVVPLTHDIVPGGSLQTGADLMLQYVFNSIFVSYRLFHTLF